MKLAREIEKTFPQIEKLFDKASLDDFSKCDYIDLPMYHFGLGTSIRNSEIFKVFVNHGITQKDDMSSLLIHLFYAYNKKEI